MKYYFRENIRRYEQMLDQGFDAWSERLYGGTDYDHFSSRPFLDLILPKLSLSSADPTALELGTGVGPGAFLLDEHGYRTTGYDLIPEAIVAARENAAAKGRAITFEVMDVTEIPHEGERFDLIVDSYCINHVVFDHERTAVFESVKARLNPRGYYLVTSSVYNPSRHHPERKVADTATGKVYDTYGDDVLYDPQTDYYYEPLGKFPSKREQTAELQDTFEVNGTTYIPKRCYRDGKRLRAELMAHGFRCTLAARRIRGESRVCTLGKRCHPGR